MSDVRTIAACGTMAATTASAAAFEWPYALPHAQGPSCPRRTRPRCAVRGDTWRTLLCHVKPRQPHCRADAGVHGVMRRVSHCWRMALAGTVSLLAAPTYLAYPGVPGAGSSNCPVRVKTSVRCPPGLVCHLAPPSQRPVTRHPSCPSGPAGGWVLVER